MSMSMSLLPQPQLQFPQIAALAREWEATLLGSLSSTERVVFDRVLTKLTRQVEAMPANVTAAAARG